MIIIFKKCTEAPWGYLGSQLRAQPGAPASLGIFVYTSSRWHPPPQVLVKEKRRQTKYANNAVTPNKGQESGAKCFGALWWEQRKVTKKNKPLCGRRAFWLLCHRDPYSVFMLGQQHGITRHTKIKLIIWTSWKFCSFVRNAICICCILIIVHSSCVYTEVAPNCTSNNILRIIYGNTGVCENCVPWERGHKTLDIEETQPWDVYTKQTAFDLALAFPLSPPELPMLFPGLCYFPQMRNSYSGPCPHPSMRHLF